MARPLNLNGGRPPKEIDEELLKKLSGLHLSTKVMADILGVSTDTLERRYAAEMEQWRSETKGKIAEVLFDEGVTNREPWALKALAQKHLDYSDKVETKNETKLQVDEFVSEWGTSEPSKKKDKA